MFRSIILLTKPLADAPFPPFNSSLTNEAVRDATCWHDSTETLLLLAGSRRGKHRSDGGRDGAADLRPSHRGGDRSLHGRLCQALQPRRQRRHRAIAVRLRCVLHPHQSTDTQCTMNKYWRSSCEVTHQSINQTSWNINGSILAFFYAEMTTCSANILYSLAFFSVMLNLYSKM